MNIIDESTKEVIIGLLRKRKLLKKMAEEIADEIIEIIEKEEEELIGGWSVIDVYHQANNIGLILNETEAEEIFENLRDGFDASIGIRWDTLSHYIVDSNFGRSLTKKELKEFRKKRQPIVAS